MCERDVNRGQGKREGIVDEDWIGSRIPGYVSVCVVLAMQPEKKVNSSKKMIRMEIMIEGLKRETRDQRYAAPAAYMLAAAAAAHSFSSYGGVGHLVSG